MVWPGELMSKTIYDDINYITIKKELNMTNIIFNDGSNQIPEINQPGFSIKDNCFYNFTGDEREYDGKDYILEDIVFFKVPSHWNKNNVRAHYYNEQGGNNGWPGELMSKTIYDDINYITIKKELNMTNIIFNDGSNQIPDISQPGCSIVNFGLYYSIEDEKNLNENDIKDIYDNQYPILFTNNDGKKDSFKLRGNISINKKINSSNGLSGNIGFSKSKPYIDLTKKNDLGMASLKTKGKDVSINQEIKNLNGFSGNVGFSENKPYIGLTKKNDLGMISLKTKGNDISINQEIKNLKGFSGNVGFTDNKPSNNLFKNSSNSKINVGYDGNLNFGFNNGPCDFGLSCSGSGFSIGGVFRF